MHSTLLGHVDKRGLLVCRVIVLADPQVTAYLVNQKAGPLTRQLNLSCCILLRNKIAEFLWQDAAQDVWAEITLDHWMDLRIVPERLHLIFSKKFIYR